MTHASVAGSPLEVPDSLVRLSVGIESSTTSSPTSSRPSTGSDRGVRQPGRVKRSMVVVHSKPHDS